LLVSATQTAKRLDGAVVKVDAILEEVRTGDGTAHSLFYGSEGKRALDELGSAAAQVATLLETVKTSDKGAAHALLYGNSKALVDDLSASATSIKRITDKVDRGEGSLGALINDPSAYEDLKTILGNVKRNRLLRELVRMSISNRSEFERTGEAAPPGEETK
jgi:phospholipid/cholesterol/gamma-HCH transport system substrate-binding protein